MKSLNLPFNHFLVAKLDHVLLFWVRMKFGCFQIIMADSSVISLTFTHSMIFTALYSDPTDIEELVEHIQILRQRGW
jgi:hypothetical protein